MSSLLSLSMVISGENTMCRFHHYYQYYFHSFLTFFPNIVFTSLNPSLYLPVLHYTDNRVYILFNADFLGSFAPSISRLKSLRVYECEQWGVYPWANIKHHICVTSHSKWCISSGAMQSVVLYVIKVKKTAISTVTWLMGCLIIKQVR